MSKVTQYYQMKKIKKPSVVYRMAYLTSKSFFGD